MSNYNNYPATDEDFAFPEAVRKAFAASAEFKEEMTNQIGDSILEAINTVAPGAVQDYATRELDFSTTNTLFSAVTTSPPTGAVITGLDLEVTGTGRMVELHFHAPQAYCSTTAGRSVAAYLITATETPDNYSAGYFRRRGAVASPMVDRGNSLDVSWDVQTELDTLYFFKVGIATMGVGTSRLDVDYSGAKYPITFKARNH
jgi:hypothetical protein